MKFASWNIEWMNNWFIGGNQVALRPSYDLGSAGDAIADVPALCERIAQVIRELDADILCVQEGPSDIREMELFLSMFLPDGVGGSIYQAFGGYDGLAQKIYILVKHQGKVTNARPPHDDLSRALADAWECDTDGTSSLQPYRFTRRPVVVDCDYQGRRLRVVAIHSKSKFIHNGAAMWSNPNHRAEFVREAVKQRRRISAESMRVRRYLDNLLQTDPHDAIIVAGDLNDGPGADYFEDLYLTHNVTDILLGTTYQPAWQFEHAFLWRLPQRERYTAIFDDFVTKEKNKLILLDHILVSPSLKSGGTTLHCLLNGGIAHQAFERAIHPSGTSSRERFPSDHRPVYAVFGP